MSSIIRDNFKDSKNIYNIDIRQDVASIPINNYKDGMMFLDLMSRSSKQGYNIINLIINNLGKEEIEISKIEKIEISKIIDNIILQYHLEDKDLDLIHCSIKRNFSFLGDRHLFTYVIFNLLKNALIYRGKIEIYTSQSNNYNLLFFRNYKSYIIESDINFIFNDSKNKNEFSLGLPFCKKIMNKFNGDIECSSRKEGQEKWTEFKLSFPVIK
jgi:two-component system CAI-1 autoinducer sensor kinase/phosphatase CqsS